MMNRTPVPSSAPEESSFFHWLTEYLCEGVDHREVVKQVREDAGWSPHFAFMTLMSAGIAILGLLLSSPAVVIGAMLISPLMGPIVGLGFALATFDYAELRRTASALAVGVLLAVVFCIVIVAFSPLQTLTPEIVSRTRPNLFDLLVALFSGLAGTYSMIRGRHGTITGVAIATAIMPPLAVMGFGLATSNWTVLAGASLLFFTNLMIIAVSAAILARLYGFAADLSPRQTRLQATLIVAIMGAFAVPLGLSLKQIAWEALASRQVHEAFAATFGDDARFGDLAIDFDSDPIEIGVTVLTPQIRPDAEREMVERLGQLLGRPVQVSIDQLRIESEQAESAEIASARGARAERAAARVADRLALIAGVDADQVLVDLARRRALVRAAPLPGADLATYRALELRAARAEPGWDVFVIPPLSSPPEIEFEGDAPSEAGAAALDVAIWGARRLRLPVAVSAGEPDEAEAVLQAFAEAGVEAQAVEGEGGDNVRLRWATTRPQP